MLLAPAALSRAAETSKVRWAGADAAGRAVKIPDPGTVTILAFVRADQPQSRMAMHQLRATTRQSSSAKVIVFVSGDNAAQQARELSDLPWPLVVDSDFSASGAMSVHAWPTTLIVKSDGELVAHLAGVGTSYTTDLEAYLQLAAGKIDAAELAKRLADKESISDGPAEKAARHLALARRFLDQGRGEQAIVEIQQGLKLAPDSPGLLTANIQALLAAGRADEALKAIDALADGSIPAWQINLLRGKALWAMNRHDQAKAALNDAIKLNPNPAEAQYLIGRVHEEEKDFTAAAAAYRKAYEAARSPTTGPK